MDSIAEFLGSDHQRCDEFFYQAEASVSNGNWEQANDSLNQFNEALERHLAMEEKVMFVAFEKATGSSEGPTAVMRMEHEQMRSIIAMMRNTLAARDADAFLGYSETLNTMMQQHNMKEESVLYQMADRVLTGRQNEIINAMGNIDATA